MIITDNLGIKDKAIDKLKEVFDPEIPVDIYELGLVYELHVRENGIVKVTMTLTAPNCPVVDQILRDVEQKLGELEEVKEVRVEITFDPPWTQELMSEEAKLELGML